jgi:DNA invertase Pin-like site-specific DNA recombinase
MKAIIYLRVSTDEQAKSGLGLEAQRAACEERARALKASSVSVFADEGVSGSTPIADRAALPAALEALGRGDALIIAKRDRLARDYMMAGWVDLEVARKGARIVSAAGEGTDSDDPMSRVMRVIVDAFAQYERDMIRARTKAALGAKRARGEKCGGPVPFGFRVVGTEIRGSGEDRKVIRILGEDAAEQAAIVRMRELRAQGLGYRRIAEQLAREGVRGRDCSALAHTTVKRVLSAGELATAAGTADVA